MPKRIIYSLYNNVTNVMKTIAQKKSTCESFPSSSEKGSDIRDIFNDLSSNSSLHYDIPTRRGLRETWEVVLDSTGTQNITLPSLSDYDSSVAESEFPLTLSPSTTSLQSSPNTVGRSNESQ